MYTCSISENKIAGPDGIAPANEHIEARIDPILWNAAGRLPGGIF
jgi:hypothetical protein